MHISTSCSVEHAGLQNGVLTSKAAGVWTPCGVNACTVARQRQMWTEHTPLAPVPCRLLPAACPPAACFRPQIVQCFKEMPELARVAVDPFLPVRSKANIMDSLLKDSGATDITKRLFGKTAPLPAVLLALGFCLRRACSSCTQQVVGERTGCRHLLPLQQRLTAIGGFPAMPACSSEQQCIPVAAGTSSSCSCGMRDCSQFVSACNLIPQRPRMPDRCLLCCAGCRCPG
jgi:hypothetical protein